MRTLKFFSSQQGLSTPLQISDGPENMAQCVSSRQLRVIPPCTAVKALLAREEGYAATVLQLNGKSEEAASETCGWHGQRLSAVLQGFSDTFLSLRLLGIPSSGYQYRQPLHRYRRHSTITNIAHYCEPPHTPNAATNHATTKKKSTSHTTSFMNASVEGAQYLAIVVKLEKT